MPAFTPGDVVELQSGSVPLTVKDSTELNTRVVWLLDSGELKELNLPTVCFKAYVTPTP